MLSWELKETLENQPLNFAHDETEAERCQGIIQGHIAGTDGFFAVPPQNGVLPLPFLMVVSLSLLPPS